MRYRHSNNYTQKWLKRIIMIIRFHNRTEVYLIQKWLKKIIMLIRFHNRTEIYLIQKVNIRNKEKNIHKSKYIREKKKKRKNTKLIREQMSSGLQMICLIRIYTSYRIQRFGAGVGSNGARLKASN